MTARRRLRHTVTGDEFDAAASAVDTYRRGGWVPVDELPDEPALEPALDAGGELPPATSQATDSGEAEGLTEIKPPSRRRTMKEES